MNIYILKFILVVLVILLDVLGARY